MSRVRVASGPLWQVQLWKHALAEKDIAAEVTGEALGALTGVMPIGFELPVLHVEEADVERARAVIREVNEQHGQPGVRTCPKCREENPAHFASCWHCGAPLESAPVTPEKPSDAATSTNARSSGAALTLALLFATTSAVLAVLLWQSHQTVSWSEEHYGRWELHGDDCQVLTMKGRKRAISCDFNRDGFFEIRKEFDREERLEAVWRDTNSNGVLDEAQEFNVEGRPVAVAFDRDEDGRFEERLTYDQNGKPLRRTTEVRKDGVETREETLDQTGAVLSESRANLDGTWSFHEKNRVWRGSSERAPAETLTISFDGGVRTQHLTDLGWVDMP